MRQEEITRLFPMHIRKALSKAAFDMEQVYEIRLRVRALDSYLSGKRVFSFPNRETFP